MATYDIIDGHEVTDTLELSGPAEFRAYLFDVCGYALENITVSDVTVRHDGAMVAVVAGHPFVLDDMPDHVETTEIVAVPAL